VRPRDRDDQPEIGLDHLRLRRHVAALDPLREGHLLVSRQQRYLPDLAQVEAQRVERRLDGQVELRRLLRLRVWERGLRVRRLLVLLPLDQLDRAFEQVGVEVLHLLRLQLDVLKPGSDFVVGQKPLLKTIRDEPLQFLGVETTRSPPALRAEKPCALSGSDLPVGEAEPGLRGLHHRHIKATRSECSSCAVAPAPGLPPEPSTRRWQRACRSAQSQSAAPRGPTAASPGRKPLRYPLPSSVRTKPKSFASSSESIVGFTDSPACQRRVASGFAPTLASDTSGRPGGRPSC
jgi:hypothetical protein